MSTNAHEGLETANSRAQAVKFHFRRDEKELLKSQRIGLLLDLKLGMAFENGPISYAMYVGSRYCKMVQLTGVF